ncbi:Low calcium response locus protein H [Chlamydiales bacterium STE3]|nr:Low calcium response locus protein H [Chlamydiales bacterium STE3]
MRISLGKLAKLQVKGRAMSKPWPTENPEAIYAYAYQFYLNGHYQEAQSLFSLLTIMGTKNVQHWLGLGASLQMQKKYDQALEAYGAAALVDIQETNPFPHFYAAECLLSLNQVKRALQALESASTIAFKDKKYIQLNSQINLIKSAWNSPEVINANHKS